MGYTHKQLTDDKLLIAQLLYKKRYKEAKEFAKSIHLMSETQSVTQFALGMLFVLEMISPDERYG